MKRILVLLCIVCAGCVYGATPVLYVGNQKSDLYRTLQQNNVEVVVVPSISQALSVIKYGQGLVCTADEYPSKRTEITASDYNSLKHKGARVYIEYPSFVPNVELGANHKITLERVVVTSDFWGKTLPPMSIMGINGHEIIEVNSRTSLLSVAKVAGFDKAQFGLTGTRAYPLLFMQNNVMVATTALSDFEQGRFGPSASWRIVLDKIICWVTGSTKEIIKVIPIDPTPSYMPTQPLDANAKENAIKRGADWLWNARLFIHPTWAKQYISQYQPKDGNPNHYFGPAISSDKLVGDGSFGVMEGHASEIYADGSQKYRYFIRADVQGETAMLLSSASMITGDTKYARTAERLLDYLFYTSEFRGQTRGDSLSASYGLLGWSNSHLWAFFNDDNARCMLGAIGASAMMNNQRWNKQIVENILANLRTCSRQGFQGGSLNEQDILKNGWQYYNNRDFINPHPHFESWMWACYLWLYDKTGYDVLLQKAKEGIRITMENYPDKWHVQNGMWKKRIK